MSTLERTCLTGLVWTVCVLFAGGLTVADPDLWGHTLYGRRAIERGVLLERTDPFSYTQPGAEWVNHEWLTELQFGWLWNSWGSVGLWMWRNAHLLLVFGIAAYAWWREQATIGAGMLLFVFSAETLSHFFVFVRPQLTTFVFFALSLLILREYWERSSNRAIWLLPPMCAIWVNLHGGWLAGLAIQGLFVAGFAIRALTVPRDRRPFLMLAAVFLASLLASFVNPYGLRMHAMLWQHLGTEQFVREWQPIWSTGPELRVLMVPFLLIAIAFFWSRRWQWIDLIVFAAVGYQAVSHLRHVALLSIATLVLLPGLLSDALRRLLPHISEQMGAASARWKRILSVVAIVGVLAAWNVWGSWKMWQQGSRPWDIAVETQSYVPGVPLPAVAIMKQYSIHGNLVTDYGWAQFALWHLFPGTKIAFDGRYRTVYPRELEREFMEFYRTDGRNLAPTPILDSYETEIALVPVRQKDGRHGGPRAYLEARDDWALLFADSQAALFVRDIPKYRDLIDAIRKQPIRVPQFRKWVCFPGDVSSGGTQAIPVDSALSGD